jgi:hypothetical protein
MPAIKAADCADPGRLERGDDAGEIVAIGSHVAVAQDEDVVFGRADHVAQVRDLAAAP